MTEILLPLPGGARLRLSPAFRRPAVWRADLLQTALAAGPEGLVLEERADLVCDGLAIEDGGPARAEQIARRVAGSERAPLERLLATLGGALARQAGLAGPAAWTIEAVDQHLRILDRHGNTRANLPLYVPGWADLPGRHLQAGRDLVPRAALPEGDSAHARAARAALLCEALQRLRLPPDLPERLDVADLLP